MSQKALIIVDFEKEWTNPNSELFLGDVSDAIEKTNRLIDYCRENDYKIIFTRHIEEDSEDDIFAKGSENTEIMDEIHKKDTDIVINKHRISPFYKANLENELCDTEEVVIVGILTNLCVRSTVQDTYDRDFDITVIKDCCVAFNEETQQFTFKDLKETREEVEFLNLENFIE